MYEVTEDLQKTADDASRNAENAKEYMAFFNVVRWCAVRVWMRFYQMFRIRVRRTDAQLDADDGGLGRIVIRYC